MLACSFPEWYEAFSKVTFPSVVLDLPEEVLSYLRSRESLVLPKECDGDWGGGQDGEATAWPEADEEEEEAEVPSFPDFSDRLREAFSSLGGEVFCKLNWSSPRDATWVSFGNSLRCSDLTQLFLLLKGSEFVRNDLERPFQHCEDGGEAPEDEFRHVLVLRKWSEINPAHEFRCFVSRGRLVGITQRDATACYSHVAKDRESVITDVKSFFGEFISGRFPLDSFAFDVVRWAKDVVRLVDFNPFGPPTDPILFSWEELEVMADLSNEEDEGELDFRCVEDDTGIQPNGLRQYSVPVDMVHLATGQDPDKLVDFLKLQKVKEESNKPKPGDDDDGDASD